LCGGAGSHGCDDGGQLRVIDFADLVGALFEAGEDVGQALATCGRWPSWASAAWA